MIDTQQPPHHLTELDSRPSFGTFNNMIAFQKLLFAKRVAVCLNLANNIGCNNVQGKTGPK